MDLALELQVREMGQSEKIINVSGQKNNVDTDQQIQNQKHKVLKRNSFAVIESLVNIRH